MINELTMVLKPQKNDFNKIKIECSKTAYNFLTKIWAQDININERAYILTLNRANYITGYQCISLGSDVGTVVSIKKIAQLAILSNASAVILAHNHPSGNLRASKQDILISTNLKKALILLEIELLDSIILSPDEKFYSLSDNCDF